MKAHQKAISTHGNDFVVLLVVFGIVGLARSLSHFPLLWAARELTPFSSFFLSLLKRTNNFSFDTSKPFLCRLTQYAHFLHCPTANDPLMQPTGKQWFTFNKLFHFRTKPNYTDWEILSSAWQEGKTLGKPMQGYPTQLALSFFSLGWPGICVSVGIRLLFWFESRSNLILRFDLVLFSFIVFMFL